MTTYEIDSVLNILDGHVLDLGHTMTISPVVYKKVKSKITTVSGFHLFGKGVSNLRIIWAWEANGLKTLGNCISLYVSSSAEP